MSFKIGDRVIVKGIFDSNDYHGVVFDKCVINNHQYLIKIGDVRVYRFYQDIKIDIEYYRNLKLEELGII